MSIGAIDDGEPVLTRVHISRTSRDVLGLESDNFASWTIQKALARVASEGRGVVVVLYYPESADDVEQTIEQLAAPQTARAPVATEKVFQQVGAGSQILLDLGVRKMRLMSAPFKFTGISGFDLEVVEHVDPE
jgi:3,4-dihydroxy 2-butanone 4-phosphate synthase/GTP cyclohydrolase II